MAPVGLLAILLSPWVGKNVTKIDPRKLATVSFLGFAAILWMRSRFNVQAEFMGILIPTLLQGAAMAFFFIPLTTLTLAGLPPERMASASGLSNFVRITAGAVGTSIATTLWESRAALHHAHLAEELALGDAPLAAATAQLTQAGLSAEQALQQINRLVDQQAFTRAADDIFLVSAGLFLVLIVLLWPMRRPAPMRGAAADAGGAH
jgi:DHA2 family multidrug resistance protein